MAWVLFFGSDLRDRDRVQRAAADAGLEFRVYSPGAWNALEDPAVVVVDLDRVGIPDNLPEGVRSIGYFSHVNAEVEFKAREAEITPVRRGEFWTRLEEFLRG